MFVIGSEAVYCDADDPRWIELRMPADGRLVEAARRALPEAGVEPIGTTARVGGSTACAVEAMEGYAVLRAAALAGVPAVEVRVVSNDNGTVRPLHPQHEALPEASTWRGHGADTDIVVASVKAYLAALNRMMAAAVAFRGVAVAAEEVSSR